MLDIASNLAATYFAGQINRVQPARAPAKSVIKTGAILLLSKAALELSRELQAINADGRQDSQSRQEAQEQLRRKAASLQNADEQG